MAAREKARLLQCTNNQSELGKAIIMYETEKGHLPPVVGWVNENDHINHSEQKTWVMETFGTLGRGDLMDRYRGGVKTYNSSSPIDCDPPLVYVDQLVCPTNKQAAVPGGLSYVVNMGVYDPNNATNYSGRLFRNRACSGTPGYEPHFGFVSLKTPGRTIMLSESLTAGPWTLPYTPPVAPAVAPGVLPPPAFSHWAFAWPPNTNTTMELTGVGLSSYHGGRLVVTFCDGHSETVPDTSKCWKQPNDPDDMPLILGWPQ
jgi:prepilin-type processing-associated H-X9-DG protein